MREKEMLYEVVYSLVEASGPKRQIPTEWLSDGNELPWFTSWTFTLQGDAWAWPTSSVAPG